nr:MAG TPA: hypothetical protein [Inoviridae sp.]
MALTFSFCCVSSSRPPSSVLRPPSLVPRPPRAWTAGGTVIPLPK